MDCISKSEMYGRLNFRQGHERRCIDGRITGSGNCIGYCTFDEHSGFLTRELRKEHDCIKKGCRYYLPKAKKHETVGTASDKSPQILRRAVQLFSDTETAVPLRAQSESIFDYTVSYVTITNEVPVCKAEKILSEEFGVNVSFRRLDYDFDTCVKILYNGKQQS